MCRLGKRLKNVLYTFACGILIGFFLEVILIERPKFTLDFHKNSLEHTSGITCLIIQKTNYLKYINSSINTWLKHCDEFHVVNVERYEISKLPRKIVYLPEEESLGFIKNKVHFLANVTINNVLAKSAWSGLCKALHLAKSYQTKWLIIIPDNLMVFVENLKLFIRNLNNKEDHYYGYALKNYQADYNVLSAGILLSSGTVEKVLKRFETAKDCDTYGKHWRNEDVYLGKYLKEFGIFPKDTRDEEGRGRFHGYNLKTLLWPGKLFMLSEYNKKALYPTAKGIKCCSPFPITLDVSDPDTMYKIYFFLYKLVTVHRQISVPSTPKIIEEFMWKDFLRERHYSESEIQNMTAEEYYKIWEKILPPDVMYKQIRDFIEKGNAQTTF